MLPKKLQWAVFKRDGYRCRYCSNRNALHPHHIIFKSHNGQDRMDNLITLCNSCHLDGIHCGNLLLEVLEISGDNVKVKFTRVGQWKPQ